MANRDVNLILKAQDQASKVVDAFVDALEQLRDTQNQVSSGAQSADSALAKFGQALSNVQKQIGTNSVAKKLATDMKAAEDATKRLTASITQNKEQQVSLALDADKTARRVDELRGKESQLSTELKAQVEILRQLKAAQSGARKPITAAARAGESPDSADKAAFDTATAAVEKQSQKIAELRAQLKETGQAARDAEKDSFKLAQASEAAGRAADRESSQLAEAEAALSDYRNQTTRAEAELKKFAATADRGIRQALIQQARGLRESKAAYEANTAEIAQTARALKAAEEELRQNASGLGFLSTKAQESKAKFEELQAEFNRLTERGAALKAVFTANRDALANMRSIAAQSADDIGELAARQEKFTTAQRNGATAVAAATTGLTSLNQVTDRLDQNLDQSANSTTRTRAAMLSLAQSLGIASKETRDLDLAFRKFYGGSRQALSLLQRLRGQFLALAAAYTGFYAATNQIGEVINSIQVIEAAQSRLVAVNKGNAEAIEADLDFLRRTADRLGIEFGVLADQYTKFAASTTNTAIEKDTRGIFLAVAEAARVNKLSVEQLNGTLNALSQIAAKGTVQMEELKSQLGDRLPGAIQIMADAIGVSTDELFKLTEQGELSSAALSDFARELQRRFGGGLESALATSTTAMGRFRNQVFQAQLAFADAGFDEALARLFNAASEVLQSADFLKTLQSLAKVATGVIDVLIFGMENFDKVITGVTALLALRFAPVVIVATRALFNFGSAVRGQATASMGTFNKSVVVGTTSLRTFGTAATTAALRTTALGAALRGLLISTGIGAAFVAISAAMAYFGTQASKGAEASARLSKNVDSLKNSFQNGARSVDEFAKSLETLSAAQAEADLRALRKELEATVNAAGNKALANLLNAPVTSTGEVFKLRDELVRLSAEYALGAKNAEEYANGLDALKARYDENTASGRILRKVVDDFAQGTSDLADDINEVQKALAVYALKTGDFSKITKETAIQVLGLGKATANLTGTFEAGARQAQGIEAAIREISEGIPALKKEMEAADEVKDLREILRAEGLPETIEEIDAKLSMMRSTLESVKKSVPEGGLFGTVSQGLLSGLENGIKNLEDLRALVQRRLAAINDEANKGDKKKDPVKDAIDKLAESLDTDQQDLAVSKLEEDNNRIEAILQERRNYVANLREEIVKMASPEQLKAFDDLGEKFIAFGEQVAAQDQQVAVNDAIKEFADAAQAARDEMVALSETEDTRASRLRALRIEQEQFVAEVLRGLSDQGVAYEDLSVEQKAAFDLIVTQYKKATDASFEFSEAQRKEADALQAAQDASDRLNRLIQTRQSLMELQQLQQGNGQTDAVEQTKEQIDTLDASITVLVNKAREMWAALASSDDPQVAEEAKARLAELEVTALGLRDAYEGTQVTMKNIADTVANNLSGAFETFAEAVASGEGVFDSLGKAVQSFVSDTLIQIGRAITQALILQAVYAALGIPAGGGGGITSSLPFLKSFGVNHSGRDSGEAPTRKRDFAALFGRGLRSGERMSVLENTEEVRNTDHPLHSKNLGKTLSGLSGAGGGQGTSVKLVNLFDPAAAMEAALADEPGQKVLFNFIEKNATDLKAILQ